MFVTFAAIRAKKKADEAREAARLEKRRGYDAAGRARRKAKALAESGLSDLPPSVQAQIEQTAETVVPAPEPVKIVDATVENLVARLTSIKERIFRLHAVYAVSLSLDVAVEANRYVILFQDLAVQLEAKAPDALAALTLGHEALLLSPPVPAKKSVPIEAQRIVELQWEISRAPVRRAPTPPEVPDGLGWLVG
jgi:hypothetical protein